jgi:hypothetical protein
LWFSEPHRPTKDLDFLGFGDSDIPALEKIIKEICKIDAEDGLQFLTETFIGQRIREEEAYQGVRIEFRAMLGTARISLRVDVGFGDAVTPGAEEAEFPSIIGLPMPSLRVYPKETVIAEKFEAMVRFGIANSRMKDLWDLRVLISEFDFDGMLVQRAIRATFSNRKTLLPIDLPISLSDGFTKDARIIDLWRGFISRNRIEPFKDLEQVIHHLRNYFMPIIVAEKNKTDLSLQWTPTDGWEK